MFTKRIKSPKKMFSVAVIMMLALVYTFGCSGGKYGFALEYKPSKHEKTFHKDGQEYPYQVINSDPSDYQGKLIAWFGIVKKITLQNDGRYLVQLEHRKHKARHLCKGESYSSCRVTVHKKSSGLFSVYINIAPEDMVLGPEQVQPNTLLRIFGKVRCSENDDEQIICEYDNMGGVKLDGEFYRHWPRNYYATTDAAGIMRR